MGAFMKLISRVFKVTAVCATTLLAITPVVHAQSSNQYNDRRDIGYDQVTVYADCEFRGESRSISVGDYVNMGSFDFDNDEMSSIRVPQGLEVTLYKDDKFRGNYARISRDIYCFDDTWNDETSSMRVSSINQNAERSSANRGGYESQREDSRSYRNQRGSDYRQNNQGNQSYNQRASRNTQAGVNAHNVSQVSFDNRVLQQTNNKQWQIVSPRRGVSQYNEVSRDTNSVHLQNQYTAERVRIDLFTNDVTLVDRNGRRSTFPITNKRAESNRAGNTHNSQTVANNTPNRRIKGNCFDYKAYSRGGAGGIRFHGHEGFTQFRSKPHTGRICHDGSLTMEISKTLPSSEVTVEIQGKKFRFAKNEKADAYKNTWYRKKITLSLGR
jgi:hypothetical protein